MAGLDLETLWVTVVPDESQEQGSEVLNWNTELDLDALWITVETREEQWDLRTQIDGTQALEEFDPRDIVAIRRFFTEYNPQINSTLFDIESAIAGISEYTEEELIVEHGNITLQWEFAAIWNEISEEVARIRRLEDGAEISIESDWGNMIFETKRQALAVLYAEKMSIFRIQEFLNSLPENERNMLIPWAIGILLAWIGFSLAWSARRGIWQIRYRYMSRGHRITATDRPEWGWENSERLLWEFTEYTQRREAIDLAQEVFQWNERISNRIWRSRYELFIDAYIENVRWGLPQEQTFWRNMYNTIHQRGIIWQSRDIFTSLYYFNSRDSVLETLRNSARVRQETLDYFVDWNWQTDIESIRAFMELDHDVSNVDESRIRDQFDAVRSNLLWWNLDFLFGMDLEEAKAEVLKRIAEPILSGRTNPPSIDSIIGDWTHTNPGEWGQLRRNEVTNFAFITDITQYEQTLVARMLNARLNGIEYNPDTVRWQLQSFFASIWREWGQNRYTYYSALSVIEKILEWNTKIESIRIAEEENWNDLRSRINDHDYLVNQNADITNSVWDRIIARAQAISNSEELRLFQDDILDELRDHNDRFWPWFQSAGRSMDRIIADKIRELETHWEITSAIPEPDDTRSTWLPEALEENGLRSQPIFDETWNLTSDARTLFEGNLALYAIDGNPVDENTINNTLQRLRNKQNIWEMLDFISRFNGDNTLWNLEEARIVLQDSVRYQVQDTIERAATRTWSYGALHDLNIRIEPGWNISYDFDINWVHYSWENITNISWVESQLISSLWIRDIPSSWDEVSRISYMRGIDISHLQHVTFLQNIDAFFRRAR